MWVLQNWANNFKPDSDAWEKRWSVLKGWQTDGTVHRWAQLAFQLFIDVGITVSSEDEGQGHLFDSRTSKSITNFNFL